MTVAKVASAEDAEIVARKGRSCIKDKAHRFFADSSLQVAEDLRAAPRPALGPARPGIKNLWAGNRCRPGPGRDQIEDKSQDGIQNRVQDRIRDRVQDRGWDRVQDRIRDRIEDRVRDQSQDQVQDRVQDRVQDQSWD
ncbi:hypothetical protein TURU_063044 [Turdus rufiventris]|nr:hypothetical protein TURU_063044 [Turdus rufiventris]